MAHTGLERFKVRCEVCNADDSVDAPTPEIAIGLFMNRNRTDHEKKACKFDVCPALKTELTATKSA